MLAVASRCGQRYATSSTWLAQRQVRRDILKLLSKAKRRIRALIPMPIDRPGPYELYRYTDSRGQFDYEKYRVTQINANNRKIDHVWVIPENIYLLCDYMMSSGLSPKFGICHGTRNGVEQRLFRDRLNCDVIGTEISDTAEQFSNTIQWDFHEVKDEWIGSADFIYSNSFDHAYDPEKCLSAWASCLKPTGMLFIEHSDGHVRAKETDPFGAPLYTLPYLILEWGRGRYSPRAILDGVSAKEGQAQNIRFIVVQRN